jgi:hypothetical protein
MKRIVILACALALAPVVSAQMYKYIDKDGKTVYTDQPPVSADSKSVNIPSSAIGGPAPAKTYVERDKELQKGRDKAKEGDKKSAEASTRAREDEERCQVARTALQHYSEGGRISKYNEKGERVLLGDSEIDAERAKAQRQVEQDCKGR